MNEKEWMEQETDRRLKDEITKFILEKFYEKKVEIKDIDGSMYPFKQLKYRVVYYPTLPTFSKDFIVNQEDDLTPEQQKALEEGARRV